MKTHIQTSAFALLLLTFVGMTVAPMGLAESPAFAASAPSVITKTPYELEKEETIAPCQSNCDQAATSAQVVLCKPCPAPQIGCTITIKRTVTATVWINGSPYTVSKTITLYKTGLCVRVQSACSVSDAALATDDFTFVSQMSSAQADGLMVSPDGSTQPYVGAYTLTGYGERGEALGSWNVRCI